MRTRFGDVLAAIIVAGATTGCSGASLGVDPSSVTSIPSSWLEDTAKGWPDSSGYGKAVPHFDGLSSEECLLAETGPELLDEQSEITKDGWGSYGDDYDAQDTYRYICSIWAPDIFSAELQLLQAKGPEMAQETVSQFLGTKSLPEQDNTVTTVESGQLEVHVLQTWYPTNPQGAYTALHLDEANNALFQLRITSLDRQHFDAYSDQRAADDLVSLLAGATES